MLGGGALPCLTQSSPCRKCARNSGWKLAGVVMLDAETGDEKIGNVRRPGDGVEAILAWGDASVDEVGGDSLRLRVQDHEFAVEAAVGEGGLRIRAPPR